MTKARRMMQENISLVDLVIELVDARAPLSSRNPDIDELAQGKARMVLLNKADLADPEVTKHFEKYFEEQGISVVPLDARNRKMNETIRRSVQEACKEKLERNKRRGILNRPLRAMVVGIPNVGKSTFINSFAGRASAKTGNKPGVTKGKQWIRLNKDLELLDTPGILWPKFDDQLIGLRLALLSAIREEILDEQELAVWLLSYLTEYYPEQLVCRYRGTGNAESAVRASAAGPLSDAEENSGFDLTAGAGEMLTKIAQNKNLVAKGGEPDVRRACHMVLEDFRSGRLGHITIERTS